METENWGRRIRAFRKLKGYTQIGLARKLGVSTSELGEVERENRCPSERLIAQVAKELNVAIHELNPQNSYDKK